MRDWRQKLGRFWLAIEKVFIEAVHVGQRHRALDPAKMSALAASMKELGLQQPISVHVDDEDAVHLVAGLHRLEAAKELGWEQIDASVVDLSERRREMWEIAENLNRVDLSKEQRDEHIRRYAELLKEEAKAKAEQSVKKKVVHSAPLSKGRGNKGVARKYGYAILRICRAAILRVYSRAGSDAVRNELQKLPVRGMLSPWARDLMQTRGR